jgi:negative regulator of sigma E activity
MRQLSLAHVQVIRGFQSAAAEMRMLGLTDHQVIHETVFSDTLQVIRGFQLAVAEMWTLGLTDYQTIYES